MNYVPNGTNSKLEPVAPVPPQALEAIQGSKMQRQQRIRTALFADLWALFSSDERDQRQTAEEVRAKKEERLLLLGAPVERMNRELYHPLIERSFNIAMRAGRLPRPPMHFAKAVGEYTVEFVSVLHQALKAVGISSIERTVGFAGSLAALDPSVVQKLNMGRIIEAHAEATGLPAHLLRSDAEVEQRIAAQQKQAMELQRQAAQNQAIAKGAPPAGAPAGPSPGGAPPLDPQALAVAAQADAGQPQATNTALNALGPTAAGAGFPQMAGVA
jgi:hypothetical protein